MLKANIAVFVSGGGTNLQALIDAQKSGIIESGEIKVVVSSQKDAYALTRAANAGIPGVAVVKKECGSQEAYEEALMKVLNSGRTGSSTSTRRSSRASAARATTA